MPSVASTCGSSFEPRLDRESIERRRPSEQSSAASAHPTSTEKSEGVRRGPKPKPIVEYPEPHFANWSEPPTFKASLLCKMRCLHSSRFCTDDAAVIDGHRLQLVSRRPGLCPSPVELMNTSRRAGPRRSATLVLKALDIRDQQANQVTVALATTSDFHRTTGRCADCGKEQKVTHRI